MKFFDLISGNNLLSKIFRFFTLLYIKKIVIFQWSAAWCLFRKIHMLALTFYVDKREAYEQTCTWWMGNYCWLCQREEQLYKSSEETRDKSKHSIHSTSLWAKHCQSSDEALPHWICQESCSFEQIYTGFVYSQLTPENERKINK